LSADQANQATMAQLASSRQNSLTQIEQAQIAAQATAKALADHKHSNSAK